MMKIPDFIIHSFDWGARRARAKNDERRKADREGRKLSFRIIDGPPLLLSSDKTSRSLSAPNERFSIRKWILAKNMARNGGVENRRRYEEGLIRRTRVFPEYSLAK